MMNVIPNKAAVGATLDQVDLRDVANPERVKSLELALAQYRVLIFPNQPLSM
jgi:hypothetical protein